MYEAHFGLNSRPFGAKAEGPQIFTGPQQVNTVNGVQKGLLAQDAVVTVSGPIGAGKTTIVTRALETINPNRMAAWIGRMNLAQDELLDLLLAGFGVRQQVNGSVRRFALFRRIMAERAAAGTAVAVVVEDAIRLGADTLAELEALTAADTGDAIGANIILMGPPELNQFLKDPALARLKQRVRRREKVAAFSQAEVTGYLKHCLRHAGADYDALFEPGVDQIVFRCSDGVPRVINTLCENALTAAMEAGQKRITTGLMHDVASDNYTYEGPPPDFSNAPDIDWESPPTEKAVKEAPAENDPSAVDESELPPSAQNIVVESGHYPELPADAGTDAINAASDTAVEAPDEADVGEDPALAESATEPAPLDTEPATIPAAASEPEPATAPSVEAPATPASTTPAADRPAIELPTPEDEVTAAAESPDPEIPDLINDTQPELSALPPHVLDEAVEPADSPVDPSEKAPEEKSGSTIILEKPPGIEHMVEPGESESEDEEESFDLDAALSIETDDTNLMQGITPNLDELARENKTTTETVDAAPSPALDDLPMLSNSMRVDVDKEVKKAKKAEAKEQRAAPPAPEPASPKPLSSPKPAAPESAPVEAASAQKPAAPKVTPVKSANTTKPARPNPAPTQTASEPNPASTEPPTATIDATPRPAAEKTAAPVAPAEQPRPATAKRPAPKPKPQTESAAPTQATQAPGDPAAIDKAPADAATAAKEIAEPPVSEMTARIASLDISKRGSDVDSLEAALEAAKKNNLDDLSGPVVAPQVVEQIPTANSAPEPAPVVPEITLDKELEEKQAAKRAELEKFAKEIGSANSLEEFSDAMAETLFGNEAFDAIAADVVANPPDVHEPVAESSDDHELAEPPPDGPSPVLLEGEKTQDDTLALSLEPDPEPESLATAELTAAEGMLRESQAMRAELLGSLQNDQQASVAPAAESIELGQSQKLENPAKANGAQPESIENQMDTVMTQTLAALDVSNMALPDELGDEEEKPKKKSGGLFARFRKSS